MKRRKPPHGAAAKRNSEANSTTRVDSKTESYSSISRIAFALLVVCLAILLVYLVAPGKYSGRNKERRKTEASNDHLNPSSKEGSEDADEDQFQEHGSSCDTLISEARRLVDTQPMAEWDAAIGMLAECIHRELSNPAPYWSLAIILLRRGETEDAAKFMSEALSLDPSNVEYLKSSGFVFAGLEMYSHAVFSLESYLEVTLNVHSWETLLSDISMQREDEWLFIYEAGEDVVRILEVLQSAYLKEMSLIKAGYLYKVIIGLKGEEAEMELLSSYAFFAFGLGDFVTGVKYLKLFTEKQYIMAGYGNLEQATEVVVAHSLRLFTAGFDTHISGIASNLLSGGEAIWEELKFNCRLDSAEVINFTSRVYLSDINKIVIDCFQKQNIARELLEQGAVVYADNLFGWTPLLHAVSLGSPDMVRALLESKADPLSRTGLAHTSLHIAAMRGSFDIIPILLEAGAPPDEADYFKRSPMKVACLQRWSAKRFAHALGRDLPEDCLQDPIYYPPPRLSTYGGWLPSSFALPKALTSERCDFDVMSGPDAELFLYDYLSLQRPVLVRNATNIPSMKKLHHLWHRNRLGNEYGETAFKFHQANQDPSSERMTLREFVSKMNQFHEDHTTSTIKTPINPMHILEEVPYNSSLLQHFFMPPITDYNITKISPLKFKFFLGSQLSGLPVQFHRSSWHLLVYGQKRWFLYPPDDRTYTSNEQVWSWWKNSYHDSADAMECVQYPGDLVFVPEMWGHSFITLRESIGVGSEFMYGASEFSI